MPARSPVEQRLDLLREQWMEASADEAARLFVWRVPANAERLLLAFFEEQKRDGERLTPDVFIRFATPFDVDFSYSRALREGLLAAYTDSTRDAIDDGTSTRWDFAAIPATPSPAGTVRLLDGFAQAHTAHFRHAVAVLMPNAGGFTPGFADWIDRALAAKPGVRTRLCLVDNADAPRWSALQDRHGKAVHVIHSDLDLFDVARETAAQAGGRGPQVAYRQHLTDVLTLVQKGTPQQVESRAAQGLAIAEREQWPDQQVVLHMAVAGAFLKARDFPAAVARYRQARTCALEAEQAKNPVGTNLVMQTWFGEAGVWLVAGAPERAAPLYRSAAETALRVPNRLFAIEGFRMAGFCSARAKLIDAARNDGALAVREGKALPTPERPLSTLPVALSDLMTLQDTPRNLRISELAREYREAIAAAQTEAQAAAARLGDAPSEPAIQQIELAMHRRFDEAFTRLRNEREKLIAGGDSYFRKVVAVARELLGPTWNGLPEVKHPLDDEVASWTEIPSCAQLPAPGEPESLAVAGVSAEPVEATA